MQKIPVAVLGATGSVGQRLVSILARHPWFELVLLGASGRSAGKPYSQAVNWILTDPLPPKAAAMVVSHCEPPQANPQGIRIAFSALDADVAADLEEAWAMAGVLVASNAKCHRMRADVPLIVPEINPDHLDLLHSQSYPAGGGIVTNPNCSTIGLVMALKALHDAFGIAAVHAVTLQAASGAGYPGVPFMDLIDNAIPYIGGEEAKLESEPLKILGRLVKGSGTGDNGLPGGETGSRTTDASCARIEHASFPISATCHRVAVSDGHLEAVSIRLDNAATAEAIIDAWRSWSGGVAGLGLPTAPSQPVLYLEAINRPQPRLDRGAGNGMSAVVGRLRPCPILGWKFELLSHNTIRGAAGGTVLLAELCVAKGFVPR